MINQKCKYKYNAIVKKNMDLKKYVIYIYLILGSKSFLILRFEACLILWVPIFSLLYFHLEERYVTQEL